MQVTDLMSGFDPAQPSAAFSKASPPPSVHLDQACARLKAAGLRITQPRLAILAGLIRHGQPTTIEAIHQEVGPETCDVVTIYRCMAAFEAIGIVRRAFLNNGTSLYEIDLGEPMRYHIVCKSTGAVTPLEADLVTELSAAVHRVEEGLRRRGYSAVGHRLEFFGVAQADALAAAKFKPACSQLITDQKAVT